MGSSKIEITPVAGAAAAANAGVFNIETYGATPCSYFTDGGSTTSTTFTSATASFTSSDVGKYICIEKAGASQFRRFVTTIASVSNATTVILSSATGRTQSSCRFYLSRGGDALSAINSAITACSAAGGGEVLAPGTGYEISGTIILKNHVILRGASRRGTLIFSQGGINPCGPMIRNDHTTDNGAQFCGVRSLSLEGNSTGNSNNVTTTLSANYTAGAATIDVTSSTNFLPAGIIKLVNGGTTTYAYYGGITVGGGSGGTDRLLNVLGGVNGYTDASVNAAGSAVTAYVNHGVHFSTLPYATIPLTAEMHDPFNVVEDVHIARVKGIGVSNWSQSETRLRNVHVYSPDINGFTYGFDTFVDSCTAESAGYAGFFVRSGIGMTSNCKSFSSGTIDTARGPGFLVQGIKSLEEGSHTLSACIAQDNQSQGFKIYNAQRTIMSGCQASSNSIAGDGSYAGLTTDGCTNGIFDVNCTETGHNTGDYQDNALEILNTDVTSAGNCYRINHTATVGHSVGTAIKSGSVLTGGHQIIINGADYFFGSDFTPNDHGLLACSVADPSLCNSTIAPTGGIPVYTRVKVPHDITIANVKLVVATAGASGSPANRYVGVYNSAGTRLGISAELTTSWETTGEKTHAITVDGGQSLSITGGTNVYIWVGVLIGTQYTTPVAFRTGCGSSVNTNFGVTGANVRCGTVGSGLSAFPTPTITPGSLAVANGPVLIGIT